MKTVDEQLEHQARMRREPPYGFDTLTSQCGASSVDLYLSRMYYIYHFEAAEDFLPVSNPPQICPIAVITFSQIREGNTNPITRSVNPMYSCSLSQSKSGCLVKVTRSMGCFALLRTNQRQTWQPGEYHRF